MSSIAHPYEKQIRRLIIAEVASAAANYDAFAAAAVPLSIKAFSEDGTAVVYNKPFYFAYVNAEGKVRRSDIIRPETVEYVKKTTPVAKVGKIQRFKINAVTVGKVYNLAFRISYGTSPLIYATLHASAKAETGDTPTTIAQKLATQIAINLGADVRTSTNISGNDTVGTATVKKNKYFTVSVATDTITITEKDWILDGFKVGIKEMDQLDWNVEVGSSFFEADSQVTKTEVAGTPAKNQGYEVAAAEHYLQMHSQSFVSGDVELNIREKLVADTTESYITFDASYYAESLYDPQKSDKMITIASTTAAVITAVETAFNTAMIPATVN